MLSTILLHKDPAAWNEWVFYPDFMAGWLLMGGVYLLFAGPLRDRFPGSRPVSLRQMASFWFAMVLMLVALQGPLHELSDYFLFSAHMVQHMAVMMVMPPFLLAGIPGWMVRPALRVPGVEPAARWLTRPIVAVLVNTAIFTVWHFPGPYDLMMRDHTAHVVMHLMIMASGVVMWWPVMSPLPELPRVQPALQMLYLFILGIPMMLVAAMITLSDNPLYEWYVQAPRLFGLNALEDQQLGGVIMWVPGALFMWLAITYVYFRWSQREVEEDDRKLGSVRGVLTITPPPHPE